VPASSSDWTASQPLSKMPAVDDLFIAHTCLILLSFGCLWLGQHFHDQYAEASVEAGRKLHRLVPGVTPKMVGLKSPEPFFQWAQLATYAVLAICILELVLAITTKRFVSYVSLAICCLLLVIGVSVTGVRY
jgi:hypothetical protein